MRICEEKRCSACEACKNVCPKGCISFERYDDGYTYAVANDDVCINCNRCKQICPVVTPVDRRVPLKAYAGWALDTEVHASSASGGIASSLYLYFLSKGGYVSGVAWNKDFSVSHRLTNNQEISADFRNSKYTFSFMGNLYSEVAEKLKAGIDVLFVGLPCQVAAIQKYTQQLILTDHLTTVDLVCHGTPPANYLQEHIRTVAKNHNVDQCFFRDPKYDTSYYAFTLYEKHSMVYKKEVREDDLFNWGYHNAAIYRSNCYSCPYATHDRVGDITLGDYHGLGSMGGYTGPRSQVSCIFANTEKGAQLIKELADKKIITICERPTEEAQNGDTQFSHPSKAPYEREIFIKAYGSEQDYEKAAMLAFGEKAKSNMSKYYFFALKRNIKKLIPKSVIKKLRKR